MGKVCGGETIAKRSSVIQLIDCLLIDPNSRMESLKYLIFHSKLGVELQK